MLIAVLSDTHDRLPVSLPPRLKSADEIWHLGDVCDPAIVWALGHVAPRVRVVQGNCDDQPDWPHELALELEGVRFYLSHIPPDRAPPGTQVLLHGHTHRPRDEMLGGVRWLNPGSVSQPRGDTWAGFAWLEVRAGKLIRWELKWV